MTSKLTSCGCNTNTTAKVVSSQNCPDPCIKISNTPAKGYAQNCNKSQPDKQEHIVGLGDYKVLTLIDTVEQKPFVPITSTKAVFDACGNSLDSILKKFDERLNEFDTTKILYENCDGVQQEVELVVNGNIRVVDNFITDSGAKALSARRGKYLYENITEIRTLVNRLQATLDELISKYNEVLRLFKNITCPTIEAVATEPGRNSTHLLYKDFISSGAINLCFLGFKWNIETVSGLEVNELTDVQINFEWYDSLNTLIKTLIVKSPTVVIGDKGLNKVIYLDIPSNTAYVKATVTVLYGTLKLTSENAITYYILDNYDFINDFTIVGLDYLGYTDLDGISNKLVTLYSVNHYQIMNLDESHYLIDTYNKGLRSYETMEYKLDVLYYSKSKLGNRVLSNRLPFYYYNDGLYLLLADGSSTKVELTEENKITFNLI